ncbi:NUDIX hydrolase [Nonomuraea sp. SBT364]|uniref:NUDIX hydrolase n=1 Tax=Nonomuraea sp. SBT364 TaxID=1580530 RepID=UPI00066E1A21|nr:NUDIX hydrolase [Nonomuraea sp. SBT364]
MEVVDRWTGRHAAALQAALRMTHDEFAERLGVGRRTVAYWHGNQDATPRPELQRALDTLLDRTTSGERARFAHQLNDAARPTGEPVALTVAIAVVVRGGDVLLVCRRDDAAGLRWQFVAGMVKPGQQPDSVAVRETLAETGIHCTVQEHLGGRLHPVTGVRCEYYLAAYLAGEVENRDADENVSVIWVPRDQLTKFVAANLIYPPVLHALEKEHSP